MQPADPADRVRAPAVPRIPTVVCDERRALDRAADAGLRRARRRLRRRAAGPTR
ncbi:hypothetical protein [Streptomyces sp. NPDC001665]